MDDMGLFLAKQITDRFNALSDATGLSIADMCAVYADLYLDCDKCPLKEKCQRLENIDCSDVWMRYFHYGEDLNGILL